MTEERWRQLTHWPLLITSVAFLVAYSWQVIADLTGTAEVIARGLMVLTWVVFVIDYLVRLSLASPRGTWLRTHLFDLSVVVLPALKPLRLLRALTVVAPLRRTAGAALRSRLSIYGVGALAIVVWMGSLAVLDVERGRPGANIENFPDAVWWAFVTIATVGYGDFYPVTWAGRAVAVMLMAGGVALVGVVTATLASWVIERAAQGRDDDEPATRKQVRDLSRQLSEFVARSDGDSPPPAA